jgi:2-(1,2-epoxy-1,2-dihydrophenyl)acetyl-CoA isomerase
MVTDDEAGAQEQILAQYETLRLLGRDDGGVLTLELHRPQVLNAMSARMRTELLQVLANIASGPWRALVLRGAGRAFCSGADLGAYLDEVDVEDAAAVRAYINEWNRVVRGFRALPVPSVAAVHGAAYGGGCNLALACDLVVVAESARLCQPYIDIGATADLGASWTLPRLVGLAQARRLVLLGEVVTADEAVAIGLAIERVGDEQLGSRAAELAARLAEKDPDALLANRRLLDAGAGTSLDGALEVEVEANVRLLSGAAAFRDAARRFSRPASGGDGGGS